MVKTSLTVGLVLGTVVCLHQLDDAGSLAPASPKHSHLGLVESLSRHLELFHICCNCALVASFVVE